MHASLPAMPAARASPRPIAALHLFSSSPYALVRTCWFTHAPPLLLIPASPPLPPAGMLSWLIFCCDCDSPSHANIDGVRVISLPAPYSQVKVPSAIQAVVDHPHHSNSASHTQLLFSCSFCCSLTQPLPPSLPCRSPYLTAIKLRPLSAVSQCHRAQHAGAAAQLLSAPHSASALPARILLCAAACARRRACMGSRARRRRRQPASGFCAPPRLMTSRWVSDGWALEPMFLTNWASCCVCSLTASGMS